MTDSAENRMHRIGERLRHSREENQLSPADLAAITNLNEKDICSFEEGRTELKSQDLQVLSKKLNVSCDYIIHGQHRYIKASTKNHFVPFINVDAKAGYITNHIDPKYIEGLDLYKLPGYEQGEYRIFEVDGRSMTPTLNDSDQIICEKIDLENVPDGTLNVAVTKTDVVVKRIYFDPHNSSVVILRSDNRDFEEMEVPKEEFHEVWAVKSKLTQHFVPASFDHNSRMDQLESELESIKLEMNTLISKLNGQLK